MADWNHFVINQPGKAIIDNKFEFDILELPSGRYFLNKEVVATKEVLTKLKNYTQNDLKREDSEYPIYIAVAHYEDNKGGTTTKITDPKTLSTIIQEIEESLIK
ncbi:MAG: hypothetical protein NTZ83_05105 [Candidatus Pacearchaeota archaeon]|nr:hypothetical protein [Candidatus Pacearchaeota archaeon]